MEANAGEYFACGKDPCISLHFMLDPTLSLGYETGVFDDEISVF